MFAGISHQGFLFLRIVSQQRTIAAASPRSRKGTSGAPQGATPVSNSEKMQGRNKSRERFRLKGNGPSARGPTVGKREKTCVELVGQYNRKITYRSCGRGQESRQKGIREDHQDVGSKAATLT